MVVIGGPSSQLLAGRVAAILGAELAMADYKVFPDGEAYSQVATALGDEVTVIQSTPTDRDIIYLMQLLDICQGKKISLVIPYFGYARQDKIFKPGEPMTARAVAHALNPFLGEGSRVYTINIHARSVLDHFRALVPEPGCNPPPMQALARMNLMKPVVISPDKGAVHMAQEAAKGLGAECDYLQKTRLSGTEVSHGSPRRSMSRKRCGHSG